jgi:thiamine biosynthesis protein ThiS
MESFADDLSVAELLNLQKLDPIRVAVEVNEDIVRRKDYAVARLNDGDRVEIVTFVGGG